MPKFEDHDCFLTREDEEVIKQFIDTGMFISLRRKLRSWCMVSTSHPETSRFFKSNASRRAEEVRHLVKNYNMIHPFSTLNLFWEFYIFLLFSVQYILIPIDASIMIVEKGDRLFFAKFVLDILQTADIIKLFFTGFYSEEKSKVILNCGSVARRYLKFYFFVDLLSCTDSYVYPFREFGFFTMEDLGVKGTMILRFCSRAIIFRLPRWISSLELFRQYKGFSSYVFKGIKVVLIFLVITFWAFSIHFFIDNYAHGGRNLHYQRQEWSTKIFESYFDATLVLLLVSYERYHLEQAIEYIFAIFFLCFGCALQMFVFAQILQVWTKYASAENKQLSLHKQFKEYMNYKELPLALRQRMFAYFRFKFHKQYFKESDINNMVSPLLRQEILMHVTRNHIERVEFFRHLPENLLMKVVSQLKSEIFLPGDVIISAGTTGTSMFFIYHGTVAVYTPTGKEICHLEDGAHFGEIALILSETRVASVVAVTASELFMLRRSDFLAVIEPFPEFKEQLIAIATERLHKTILKTDGSD